MIESMDSQARFENSEAKAAIVRSLTNSPLWNIDSVVVEEDSITAEGWAILDQNSLSRSVFLVNGHIFDVVENSLQRDDIGRLFWHTPGSEKSGFRCIFNNWKDQLGQIELLEFTLGDRKSRHPYNLAHNIYYHVDQSAPLPPPELRARVHGSRHEASFFLEGSSNFEKARIAIQKYSKKDYRDFNRILDWGCGCGRLTRHFSSIAKRTEITGVDIDDESVDWCSQNLGFGEFQPISTEPPTGFPNNRFDLIIGVSIFTHLREEDQLAWLEELCRIAEKDAIIAVTTNGPTTIYRSGNFELLQNLVLGSGFLDIGASSDLVDVLADQTYYRNSYHLHRYIRTRWSQYFEIIEIVSGCIGNSQDLVIMRKR